MQALAEEVGTSQQQIDRLEKGKRRLTIEWLQRLSDALHCEIVDLMPDATDHKKAAATCRTKVVGRLIKGKRIEWLNQADVYPIVVGRPKESFSNRFFALRVEASNRYKLPIGSELIFCETGAETGQLSNLLDKQHFVITSEPHVDHIQNQFVMTKWSPELQPDNIRAVLMKTIRDEL